MECILHIGIGKAGSSSIQGILESRRTALHEQGILYPLDPLPSGRAGGDNHKCLAVSCMNPRRQNFVLSQHRVATPPQRRAFDDKVQKLYARQVADSDAALCLLSAEHFWSCLPSQEEIARLRDRLTDIGLIPVRLVVYLRRQADWFESFQHQRVREGQPLLPLKADGLAATGTAEQLDYIRLIARWEEVFDGIEVVPRLFERGALLEGDLMADFCAAAAIPRIEAEAVEKNVTSISNAGVNALLLLRGRLQARRGGALDNSEWRRLTDHVAAVLPGRCAILSDREMRALDGLYAGSNEAVRRRFFPDKAALFSTRLSGNTKESFYRLTAPAFSERVEALLDDWDAAQTAASDAAAALP